VLASVVVRTLDEERHLPELLAGIAAQESELDREVVIVDSGSTDRTLEIAREHGCRIVRIERERFSFGRSLNAGCGASSGDVLVFASGHCVPADADWLERLTEPLLSGAVAYSYGRQVGGPRTRFSEAQHFRKQFPDASCVPQEGFFCNNANAALLRSVWEKHAFDEDLAGLEDMQLARRLVREGLRVGYVAEACVVHHHDETFRQVLWRFEREALALREIMPQLQLGLGDCLRYLASAVLLDLGAALQQERGLRALPGIASFRLAQYWGSWRGNHEHRQLSKRQKDHYFYPRSR
jgi:glycosyltransferase involved in cell wall biosynthesis